MSGGSARTCSKLSKIYSDYTICNTPLSIYTYAYTRCGSSHSVNNDNVLIVLIDTASVHAVT
jgi:hypothetical protein